MIKSARGGGRSKEKQKRKEKEGGRGKGSSCVNSINQSHHLLSLFPIILPSSSSLLTPHLEPRRQGGNYFSLYHPSSRHCKQYLQLQAQSSISKTLKSCSLKGRNGSCTTSTSSQSEIIKYPPQETDDMNITYWERSAHSI